MNYFALAAVALGIAAVNYAGLSADKKAHTILNPENDVVWAKKVAGGGYILHFRHAQREKWNDVTGFDAIELLKNYTPENVPFPRATCLSDQGKQEAKLIGDVFAATKVPIGRVVTSPSCRSRQTATIAFGKYDAISNSLLHRTAIPERQHVEFNKELRNVVMDMKPAAGVNNVLSGHGGTLRLDSGLVVDKNETGEGLDDREETGMVVLEIVDGKVIARYKFRSIYLFANAMIDLPVKRAADLASQ